MGRIGILIVMALFSYLQTKGQEAVPTKPEGKHGLYVNANRFASGFSLNYTLRLWQNKAQTFRTGVQLGFGDRGFDTDGGFTLPVGIFGEYGKKHRIGFDANLAYVYTTTKTPGFVPGQTDLVDVRVVYDNGAFSGSLYYNFVFGKAVRYNAGLGYSFNAFFGSNYGIENNQPDEFMPFIFFGVRF